MSLSIPVQVLSWAEGKPILADLRRRVFVEEQRVPEELEWDGEDMVTPCIFSPAWTASLWAAHVCCPTDISAAWLC